jgi:heme/copper-type cytochrome/quinol oxidase subunit 1
MIVVLIGLYTFVDTLIQQSGWTIYPPLSAIEIEPEIQTDNSYLETLSNGLLFIIVIKLIFLSFMGFKTGEIYRKSKI